MYVCICMYVYICVCVYIYIYIYIKQRNHSINNTTTKHPQGAKSRVGRARFRRRRRSTTGKKPRVSEDFPVWMFHRVV